MSFGNPRKEVGRAGGASLPQLPRKAMAVISSFLVFGIVFFWAYFSFLEYVRPYEFGIKEVKVGLNKGIQKETYGPGLWLVLPFGMQTMYRLPRQMQVLELTGNSSKESASAAMEGPSVFRAPQAKIQTSDGFFVDVDASVLYRVVDPYKVITSLGPSDAYLHLGVQPRAQPALKQTLGQLTTEEFYNSELRVAKSEETKVLLNSELEPLGIHVEQVLVRYFRYIDSIQQNIEAKKLQDQLFYTNQSKGLAAKQQQELDRVEAQGEQSVKLALQEGTAYKTRIQAEADLYTRKKEAEADLLIKLAEAQRTELRNTAMEQAGSDRLVALRMAEVLKGLETIVLPTGASNSLNPLDLNTMLETFGLRLDAASGTVR